MAMIDFNELHALVLRAPAGSVVAVSFLDGVSLVLHAPSVGQRSDVEDPSVSFTRLSSILRTAAPGTAARIAFPDGLNLSVSTNSRGRLHQAPDEAPAPTLAPEAVDALNLAPPIVPLASQAAAPPAEAAPSTAPEKEVLVPNATPAQPKEPPPPPLISSTSNSPDQGKRVERRPRFGERPVVGTVRGLEAATNSTSLASGPGEVASSSSSSSSLPLGASEPSTPATPLRASHRHTSLSPTGRRSHRKLHQIPREVCLTFVIVLGCLYVSFQTTRSWENGILYLISCLFPILMLFMTLFKIFCTTSTYAYSRSAARCFKLPSQPTKAVHGTAARGPSPVTWRASRPGKGEAISSNELPLQAMECLLVRSRFTEVVKGTGLGLWRTFSSKRRKAIYWTREATMLHRADGSLGICEHATVTATRTAIR